MKLSLFLCIIVTESDEVFSLQTYQLGRRVQIFIQRESFHVQVIIQMLNEAGLQVIPVV